MQPINDKARTVSGKPLFSRSRNFIAPAASKTPVDRQPIVQAQVTKPRKFRHADRRASGRIFKVREEENQRDPRTALSTKLTESLDDYRERLYEEATDGLGGIEKNLETSLEELTVEVEGQLQKLTDIEEPLQKSFVAEALTKSLTAKDDGKAVIEEVLLKDSISEFRTLNEDKEETLRKLWKEWEDIQFEIMALGVERFGKDSIVVMQLETEDVKLGQQERLDDMLKSAQSAYDEAHQDYADFQQDLKDFETSMCETSNQTKKAVKDMQQFYNKKKADNLKQITSLIQQIADE